MESRNYNSYSPADFILSMVRTFQEYDKRLVGEMDFLGEMQWQLACAKSCTPSHPMMQYENNVILQRHKKEGVRVVGGGGVVVVVGG